jgi:hypothetical protein
MRETTSYALTEASGWYLHSAVCLETTGLPHSLGIILNSLSTSYYSGTLLPQGSHTSWQPTKGKLVTSAHGGLATRTGSPCGPRGTYLSAHCMHASSRQGHVS